MKQKGYNAFTEMYKVDKVYSICYLLSAPWLRVVWLHTADNYSWLLSDYSVVEWNRENQQGIAMQTILAYDETGFIGACSRNIYFREPFPEKVTFKLI